MTVLLEWYSQPEGIGLMRIIEPWTWDQFFIRFQRWQEWVDSEAHDCYLLVDFSESETVPERTILELPYIEEMRSPSHRYSVLCNLTTREGFAHARLFQRIWNHITEAESVEAGAALIRERFLG